MSLIIFAGSRLHGHFAQEVAKVRGFDFAHVEQKGNIKDQTNDILFQSKGKCDYIIFDVEQYINNAEEIAEEIVSIAAATNAKPIIFAPAFNPESAMARAMIDRDIKAFILSGSATDLKDQLEKNMTGFFDVNERKEINRILEIQEEENRLMQHFKTIGIAGACHRIGTTTQAVQLVKYLNLKGYKAALIEMNSNKYHDRSGYHGKVQDISFVEKIKSWFELEKTDEEVGMIRCFNVDMFYNQSRIGDVLKMGYDYYVYDYGVYTDRDFNKTAFVREDIKLFVVGSGPAELDYTQEIAQNIFYEDAKLIFSLVAEEEQEDILMLMDKIRVSGKSEGNAARSFFAAYTPDPFAFTNYDLYDEMLPLDLAATGDDPAPVKKSRRGIFKRRKGE